MVPLTFQKVEYFLIKLTLSVDFNSRKLRKNQFLNSKRKKNIRMASLDQEDFNHSNVSISDSKDFKMKPKFAQVSQDNFSNQRIKTEASKDENSFNNHNRSKKRAKLKFEFLNLFLIIFNNFLSYEIKVFKDFINFAREKCK